MAAVGFAMLLANAASYVWGWDMRSSAFTVLGLVFVVIGLRTARTAKK